MLCEQIIVPEIPSLTTTQTVADGLLVFEDHNLSYLPILNEEKLLGIVSIDQLNDLDERQYLSTVPVKQLSINGNQHIYAALQAIIIAGTDLIPVTDLDGQFIGNISTASLLKALASLMDIQASTGGFGGAIITLQMKKQDYSFAQLSRVIESGDANITQLNTYNDLESHQLWVTIRLDRMEISDIISTLQRYEYNVVHFWGNEIYENELQRNYEALMNYLNI